MHENYSIGKIFDQELEGLDSKAGSTANKIWTLSKSLFSGF